jgi:16S rRNA (cytidine1402-2'-O)-methyltransferase
LGLVDAIYAEDTRHTLKLLAHLGIRKPLRAMHAHSAEDAIADACEKLAKGATFALVSDAGTPLVSDPGAELVRKALDSGVTVVAVPGPSAILCALVASGFGGQGFRFFGFVPRAGHARSQALLAMADTPEPVVFYESPQRTAETLAELAQIAPERSAAICRELTKIHEQVVRGPLSALATAHANAEIRGEVTIVLGPKPASRDTADDAGELANFIAKSLQQGLSVRDVAEIGAAKFGRKKSDIYALVVAERAKPRAL